MARSFALLLVAVVLLATASSTRGEGELLESIYEAGPAALIATGAPEAAAAFVPRAATVVTGAVLKRWATAYQEGIQRLLPAGSLAQMPVDFVCIASQGIQAALQQKSIVIGPICQIGTFPVNGQHQYGPYGAGHPNPYFDELQSACRTGNILACIHSGLSARHGYTGPLFLDAMPFVAPPGSGGPIDDADIQFQMLLFNIIMARRLGVHMFHVASGKLVHLLRSRAGGAEVEVPFAGGMVSLMAAKLRDLAALIDTYEDDGSWLPSEEEDDDCWLHLLFSSHHCSRQSWAAAETWAPTEAAAAQVAQATNLTTEDLAAFTRACSDDKEYTQEHFDDWRAALPASATAWLDDRIAKFLEQGDSLAKIVQRTLGFINGATLVDDGTGTGTLIPANKKGGKKAVELGYGFGGEHGADPSEAGATLVDDGTGTGTLIPANKKGGKKGGEKAVELGYGFGGEHGADPSEAGKKAMELGVGAAAKQKSAAARKEARRAVSALAHAGKAAKRAAAPRLATAERRRQTCGCRTCQNSGGKKKCLGHVPI